jgi:uncharacterized protein YccT (UPF0319 family)
MGVSGSDNQYFYTSDKVCRSFDTTLSNKSVSSFPLVRMAGSDTQQYKTKKRQSNHQKSTSVRDTGIFDLS